MLPIATNDANSIYVIVYAEKAEIVTTNGRDGRGRVDSIFTYTAVRSIMRSDEIEKVEVFGQMSHPSAYSAAKFALKMDEFIDYCKSEGIDATDYQMIEYFGITTEELDIYRCSDKMNDHSKHKKEGYAAALKKLDLYREDATIRQIVREPKLTSHGALKLKQLHWGGWGDKQKPSANISIRLKAGDCSSELFD